MPSAWARSPAAAYLWALWRAGGAEPAVHRRPADAAGRDHALDHDGVCGRAGASSCCGSWPASSPATSTTNGSPCWLDPFGMRALGRATRYFSTAESNAGLPAIGGYLLANRLLWSVVGLALLGLPPWCCSSRSAPAPASACSARPRLQRRPPAPPAHVALPRIAPRFTRGTRWTQCWHIFVFDAVAVFKSVPFLVMLLFGVLNMVGSSSQLGQLFGTDVYPLTYLMIELLKGSYNFLLLIIVIFYAGELIFKERQAGIADVNDAMPMPNWAPLVAKSLALVGVVLAFLLAGILTAIAIQLYKGGAPIEPMVYLQGVFLARHAVHPDGADRRGAAGHHEQQVHRLPLHDRADRGADRPVGPALRSQPVQHRPAARDAVFGHERLRPLRQGLVVVRAVLDPVCRGGPDRGAGVLGTRPVGRVAHAHARSDAAPEKPIGRSAGRLHDRVRAGGWLDLLQHRHAGPLRGAERGDGQAGQVRKDLPQVQGPAAR